MEGQRKRKRAESDDAHSGGGSRRRRKERERVDVAPVSIPAPTDDEVDEFYAILRRMHVAVKYFEKSHGNDRRKLTERLGTPLESEAVSPEEDDDVKFSVNRVGENNVSTVLDLNTVPDGETD